VDKVRIEDIASKSGVSLTTVSRYFNKPELLSQKTQLKIEAVIKELNYSQNNLARILVTGKSNLIGIIIPHFRFSFYIELINQLVKQGKEYGYHFIVHTTDDSKEMELDIINELISYRVKGLIVLSHTLSGEELEAIPVPIITVERSGGNFMQINSDNMTGGKLAAELLIKNQCKVFIHINNDYIEDLPSFKRIIGFEFALKNYISETIIERLFSNPYSEESNHTMSQLLEQLIVKYQGRKIGIFCSNDDIANLVLNHCIKKEIQIPDQIELIGYDNSPTSYHAVYPITSVAQNMTLMAKIALESLENYHAYESIVPAVIYEKETTT